jgi:hypothetical protein
MGEINGKLPLITCPGCSVSEPYQSPDWALVPAKPAQGLNTTTNNNILIMHGQSNTKYKKLNPFFVTQKYYKRHGDGGASKDI